MNNELKIVPGAQYKFNNDIYEVVTSDDLITIRSINTKIHRHIGVDDFTAMLANQTITKYQNAPIDLTSAPKMEEFVVDNGAEVRNERVKIIARLLGIELRYVPPGQPNAKAFTERFFQNGRHRFGYEPR
ncbi:DDE-type integrase/transposase/recombinase [Pseudomonas sp. LFM046]|uniref:DDE-type integrase/transposase/recombinase n=1 Tax=Pseudomonas sp. LFM046 TaxID=1608357 RepID=UPI000A66F7BB|nr:DDE-type integrase/transposase/recombinase [Pseudomonas sp. LFM046]